MCWISLGGGRWDEAADEDGLISAPLNTITLFVYSWYHLNCEILQRKVLSRGPGKFEIEVENVRTQKTSEKLEKKLSEELGKWCKKYQQSSL